MKKMLPGIIILAEESADRVLSGGCFHNGGIHCTVMKRYEINPEYKDQCIGFRIILDI